ncbi:MAG: FAD-binding oxidoreductase [Promethearchaeati archaeon SRVP18_Atabeyarchaeia-1]
MSEKYDIAVVGAGIFGVASAYYLQKNNPGKRILLIDRLADAGQANTAMSAAAVRNMFSSRTNQILTDTTISYYINIQEKLKFDLDLQLVGYLWLLTQKQLDNPLNRKWMEKMDANNIKYALYEGNELKKRLPELSMKVSDDEEAKIMGLEDVAAGLYGPKCGTCDPSKLVAFYKNEFVKMSKVKPMFSTEVKGLILEPTNKLGVPGEPFIWQDSTVVGVKTAKGEIRADTVVMTAGTWVNQLTDPIGVDGRVKVKKRQLFRVSTEASKALKSILNAKGFNKFNLLPFTILPRGVYLRPVRQEESFWVGCADKLNRAFKYVQTEDDWKSENTYFEQSMYPVLSKYLPAFRDIRPASGWAGAYAYSYDAVPYVYKEAGMIFATGDSGSGIMKGDALGRMVDALYRGEKVTTLYDGVKVDTDTLSVGNRKVEKEDVLI